MALFCEIEETNVREPFRIAEVEEIGRHLSVHLISRSLDISS